ncbi:MAG: site-specific integrase [Magnetovibrio sp.]|nr:site-specific integrase [Magnetovibrio sp.]
MRIYKRKSSPKWWADWTDQKGRRFRKSTGTNDKALAKALAGKWQQESFLEQHFGVIPDVPFQDALLRYGEEKQQANPEGYTASVRYNLQHLLNQFGRLNLSEFNLKMLQDYANERLSLVKSGTVHRDLAVVRAILNKAHREGQLAIVPPFPKVKPSKGRSRWLTVDEEERLLQVSKPHLRGLIAFAVDTGGRRSELFKLDWQNVDLDRGFVTFTKTKNGEDRSVRLTKRAKWVLMDLNPKKSGSVFTYKGQPIKDVKTTFGMARKKAGLEDFRFHDLRHTFASRLVQKGISIYEVMHLTGHKSLEMVQRYAHLAPDYQNRAIEALDELRHNIGTVGRNEGEDKTLSL